MGWNFCKKALKKIIHLFNEHMPQLTQIACSTVLRMQIHFAWKSIWSCLKESRTALLLSPLTGSRGAPSRRLSPLVWKTSSPALHAWARGPRQSVAEPKTPWANMQIWGLHWRPRLQAGRGALQLCAHSVNTCNTSLRRESSSTLSSVPATQPPSFVGRRPPNKIVSSSAFYV